MYTFQRLDRRFYLLNIYYYENLSHIHMKEIPVLKSKFLKTVSFRKQCAFANNVCVACYIYTVGGCI